MGGPCCCNACGDDDEDECVNAHIVPCVLRVVAAPFIVNVRILMNKALLFLAAVVVTTAVVVLAELELRRYEEALDATGD